MDGLAPVGDQRVNRVEVGPGRLGEPVRDPVVELSRVPRALATMIRRPPAAARD